MQVTFHKVVEAEVEAASRGASADEVAQLTGQPENARLVTLLKGGALSVTINKGTAKQRPGTAATSSQPDLANQVSRNWLFCTVCRCISWLTAQSMHVVRFCCPLLKGLHCHLVGGPYRRRYDPTESVATVARTGYPVRS